MENDFRTIIRRAIYRMINRSIELEDENRGMSEKFWNNLNMLKIIWNDNYQTVYDNLSIQEKKLRNIHVSMMKTAQVYHSLDWEEYLSNYNLLVQHSLLS